MIQKHETQQFALSRNVAHRMSSHAGDVKVQERISAGARCLEENISSSF